MSKYLLTGAAGFVGAYFLEHLAQQEPGASVLCLDALPFSCAKNLSGRLQITADSFDLLDEARLKKGIQAFAPERIVHLASLSSVAYSWQDPAKSFRNNTNIFLSLLEAVRHAGLPARILSVGSSEEYGNVKPADLPLTEETPLNPVSPYAIARVAQEMLSKLYVESYGLDIVMTRSFNHIGPGQNGAFVVPSLIRQALALTARGEKNGRITAGDTTIVRDFMDVRDVCSAYYLLLRQGVKGEAYNVCSGQGVSIAELVARIGEKLGLQLAIDHDQRLIRPNDNPVIVGSNEKLQKATGWNVCFDLASSLSAMIDAARGPEAGRTA